MRNHQISLLGVLLLCIAGAEDVTVPLDRANGDYEDFLTKCATGKASVEVVDAEGKAAKKPSKAQAATLAVLEADIATRRAEIAAAAS